MKQKDDRFEKRKGARRGQEKKQGIDDLKRENKEKKRREKDKGKGVKEKKQEACGQTKQRTSAQRYQEDPQPGRWRK